MNEVEEDYGIYCLNIDCYEFISFFQFVYAGMLKKSKCLQTGNRSRERETSVYPRMIEEAMELVRNFTIKADLENEFSNRGLVVSEMEEELSN